jgi:hypothetical protein
MLLSDKNLVLFPDVIGLRSRAGILTGIGCADVVEADFDGGALPYNDPAAVFPSFSAPAPPVLAHS